MQSSLNVNAMSSHLLTFEDHFLENLKKCMIMLEIIGNFF